MSEGDMRPLRRGWTTGACATAAAKAAASALLGPGMPRRVAIRLPRGGLASFEVADGWLRDGEAMAAVVKDAGDDPDVTHGCRVEVRLRRGRPGVGISFRAGEGVGTVTLPGLPLPPGEPAINPAPRRMIAEALVEVAGGEIDLEVTVGIPGGEALAARTMNGRLGIVGGLSILGTTGIVVPFSCSAWIHSIHRGIDVARAAGLSHLGAATGSTSEAALRDLYGMGDRALLDMGDFVGGTLKYLRNHPVGRLSLAGGFAKLAKLAQGHLDLHSGRSTLDAARLADRALEAGAPPGLAATIRGSGTALAMFGASREAGFPLAELVAADARSAARSVVGEAMALDVIVVDREGRIAARAGPT